MITNSQGSKARIGAIGENLVVAKLMQHGWDAFNVNCTIKNCKSIDVVCINSDMCESDDLPWKPRVALVQVKTCNQANIPVGFTIAEALDRELLERNVKGPYVFVYAQDKGGEMDFRCFIISRREFIDLLYKQHCWYVNGWKRQKPLETKAPACLTVKDLLGLDQPETARHAAFTNPLEGKSCENRWDNIWED